MIRGALGTAAPRTALLVVCHAELARDALDIDPRLAGLLPCPTVVHEVPDDDRVHVHHVPTARTIREPGDAPPTAAAAVDRLVERSGEYMTTVWENIEAHAGVVAADEEV